MVEWVKSEVNDIDVESWKKMHPFPVLRVINTCMTRCYMKCIANIVGVCITLLSKSEYLPFHEISAS